MDDALFVQVSDRVAEAAASLGQAVRLAPGRAENHYNLALALERLGRDRDAIAALRQAITTDANHPAALERLGNLLVKHGRGIYLMKTLMDEVRFEQSGALAYMRKKPSPRSAAERKAG